MLRNNTILVTGGCGFIGSEVIRQLIASERYTVVNVDKLTYASNRDSLASIVSSPNYHFEHVDICDQAEITRVFQQYSIDFVLHLAAESHVDRSIDSPTDFIQTNIVGTYTLLQTAYEYWRQLDTIKQQAWRFHHVSTDEVFGDLTSQEPAFTEHTSYKPSSPYSASKASADHLVHAWQRTYGLPTIITNCSNNYGPYQLPDKLIPLMIYNALQGKPLPIYGDGQQIRDWLYVADHAAALIHTLENAPAGERYNIGGNHEMTNLNLVTQICESLDELMPNNTLSDQGYKQLITFVTDRPGHDQRYAIDNTKIMQNLGWQPRESFNSGLRKTIEWYLDNQRWCKNALNNKG